LLLVLVGRLSLKDEIFLLALAFGITLALVFRIVLGKGKTALVLVFGMIFESHEIIQT